MGGKGKGGMEGGRYRRLINLDAHNGRSARTPPIKTLHEYYFSRPFLVGLETV